MRVVGEPSLRTMSTAEPEYVPEADDDSFDLLLSAIIEHVDAATYHAILATLEKLFERRRMVRAASAE
jgi:hypothetical protein